ncbi:hypothetical protein WJX77_005578 [Trebouxia sp. C0004]
MEPAKLRQQILSSNKTANEKAEDLLLEKEVNEMSKDEWRELIAGIPEDVKREIGRLKSAGTSDEVLLALVEIKSTLLLVDEISEAHSDADSFAQAIETELQRAPGLTAKSVWDQLETPLLDELYSSAASTFCAHTKPLNGGKTSVQAGRWDIEAEAREWLAKQRNILKKVYCFPFPVQEDDQVTEETYLYTPIYTTIYKLVNVAAEALGLNVKLSKAKGMSAVTHSDGRAVSMPELFTVLVHEIKARGQESHDDKHFVDLLTSHDAELRIKVANPVAQAFGYAVEEGVQHGIIGSKRFHVFFKRGWPLQDKIVYFKPMPANQHPETPDEDKMVHSEGRIGTFVPSVLTRHLALSMTEQLSHKRPSDGPDDEHGDHAGGASKRIRDAPVSGRYNLRQKAGSQSFSIPAGCLNLSTYEATTDHP